MAYGTAILDRLDDGTNNRAAIVSAKSGDPLPNSPENSATLALDYHHPAPMDGWNAHLHLDGNYRSSTYSRLFNSIPGAPVPFLIQSFRSGTPLSTSRTRTGSTLGSMARTYSTSSRSQCIDLGEAGPPPTNARAAHYYIGRPRTIGVRLGYKFDD